MREIKFRGQTYDTPPHWVFGDLYHYTTGEPAINYPHPHKKWLVSEPVRPATFGQFTGLKDSNGKEIYEGDIVKIKDLIEDTPFGVVTWHNDSCRFIVLDSHLGCHLVPLTVAQSFIIIGNVHDDPEFLELQEDA